MLEARLTTRGWSCCIAASGWQPPAAPQGGFTTVVEHLPAAHQGTLQWTRALGALGPSIGVATSPQCSGCWRTRHPEHSYRACLGLLSLRA